MTDFHLVDLNSQADAVWGEVRGWTAAAILEWLRQFGTVEHIPHPSDDYAYRFRSRAGMQTTFRLTADGQLYIVRNHHLYQPQLKGLD